MHAFRHSPIERSLCRWLLTIAACSGHTVVRAAEPEPSRLFLRVEDTAGRPVQGALVRILVRIDDPAGDGTLKTELVAPDGQRAPTTDAQGKVITPPMRGGRSYVLQVDAEGMLPGLSRWSRLGDRGLIVLPKVVLRRLQSVSGLVVGRDGLPVSGAKVFQSGDGPERTSTTTDGQGRFTIGGIPEGTAFLFVEKTGYRFYGQPVASRNEPTQMVVERLDEPQARTMRTLPLPRLNLPAVDRKATALKLLLPRFDRLMAGASPQWDFWVFMNLAELDPEMLLPHLDSLERAAPEPSDWNTLLRGMACGFVRTNAERAQALVERMTDPLSRISAYQNNLVAALPPSARMERLQMLQAAAQTARQIEMGPDRISSLSEIAANLAHYGFIDDARNLLVELEEFAEKMQSAPTVRAGAVRRIAQAYAGFDVERALSLAGDPDDEFYLHAARAVARRDPARAESLLDRVDFGRERRLWDGHRLHALAYDLALADPARADRVISDIWRRTTPAAAAGAPDIERELQWAQVLGLLAERAAKSDTRVARKLLERAVAALRPLPEGYLDPVLGWYYAPATILATLIPVAERIDPALSCELFWRSLSLRLPRLPGDGELEHGYDISLEFLCLMLCRYDRDVAKSLFEDVAARDESRQVSGEPLWVWLNLVRRSIDPQGSLRRASELADMADDLSLWEELVTLLPRELFRNEPEFDVAGDERAYEQQRRRVRRTMQCYLDPEAE